MGTICQKHTCSRMHIFWTIKRWKLWSILNQCWDDNWERNFTFCRGWMNHQSRPIQEILIHSCFLPSWLFGDLLLREILNAGLWMTVYISSLVNYSCLRSAQQNCQRRTAVDATAGNIFWRNIFWQWYRYKPNGTLWKHIGAYCLYFLLWTAFMSSQ